VVLPGEEEAMCFKWIQTIRRVNDDVPTGRQDAIRLLDGASIVVDVFDDLVQQDDVEAAVIERQLFGGRGAQIR